MHAASESILYNKLFTAGLMHWIPVFATLMIHYRGLEKVIEIDDEPPLYRLLRIIDDATSFSVPTWRDRLIFDRLNQLSLFNFRARNETGTWNPLEESLDEFAQRGRPIILEDIQPFPDRESISNWLRAHIAQHNKSV